MDFNQGVFRDMDPAKVEIMKELADKSRGRNLKETAPILLAAMQTMQAKNLSFTKEETDILFDILTRDMNPEEKSRVERMKKIVKSRGGR